MAFDRIDMTKNQDNGYISNYLIHWTGKHGDEKGAEVLSIIASTCRLLLSYNCLHIFDINHEIHEKMVCFTDVPLWSWGRPFVLQWSWGRYVASLIMLWVLAFKVPFTSSYSI